MLGRHSFGCGIADCSKGVFFFVRGFEGDSFAIFFACGKTSFLQGILEKYVRLLWCFGGEIVVDCVAKVVWLHHIFGASKKVPAFQIYFRFLLKSWKVALEQPRWSAMTSVKAEVMYGTGYEFFEDRRTSFARSDRRGC
jgi:hypothetical protein